MCVCVLEYRIFVRVCKGHGRIGRVYREMGEGVGVELRWIGGECIQKLDFLMNNVHF